MPEEEVKTEGAAETVVDTTSQAQQNQMPDHSAALRALAEHNPKGVDPGLKSAYEQTFGVPGQVEKQTTEKPAETEVENPVEAVGEEKPKTEPVEEKIIINSPIFGGEKEITTKKEEPGVESITFDSVEAIASHLKDNFGIEDVSKLPEKIKSWRESEKNLSEATEKVDNLEGIFKNMPPELYEAVVKSIKGEDWKEVISSPSLDFTKEAKDIDVKTLVDTLEPGKISQEEWDEFNDEDGDPKAKKIVALAIEKSKDKFMAEKTKREQFAADAIKKAEARSSSFETSLQKSAEAVFTKVEGIDKGYVENVVKQLKDPNGIYSLFYEKDGSLKENAVLNFVMAKDGYDLHLQNQKMLERKIETKVNQDLLLRGNDTPSTGKGGVQHKAEVSKEVQQHLDWIKSHR